MTTGADDWTRRIAAEFRQCPGLRLTAGQAARLFGLDAQRVERILNGLVASDVLVQTPNGMFAWRD